MSLRASSLALASILLFACGGSDSDATDDGPAGGIDVTGGASASGGTAGTGGAGAGGKAGASGGGAGTAGASGGASGAGGTSGKAGTGGSSAGAGGKAGAGGTAGAGGATAGSAGAGGSAAGAAGTGGSAAGTGGAGGTAAGAAGAGGSTAGAAGAAGAAGGTGAPPTAAELLALLGSCNKVGGDYKTDDEPGLPSNISICGLTGAVFWKADMDIDCDGKPSTVCNKSADPAFQPQTSATDSKGAFLDASKLPYVVIPLPSTRFDYAKAGLELGTVVAVIYDGKVEYGVFGDEGPDNIIGEASYAMAQLLGIDPNPATGGTDTGVTYIAFTGKASVVAKIEDHTAATTLGQQRAALLVSQN